MARKLNRKKPFDRIVTLNPPGPKDPVYKQDGYLFDSKELEIGKDPNYKPPKEPEPKDPGAEVTRRADELIELGSQVDPHAEMRRENAQALSVESLLDED